ncbi:MAG: hypothetical protein R2698_02935 [Microthrixaceae bacterium]
MTAFNGPHHRVRTALLVASAAAAANVLIRVRDADTTADLGSRPPRSGGASGGMLREPGEVLWYC